MTSKPSIVVIVFFHEVSEIYNLEHPRTATFCFKTELRIVSNLNLEPFVC